MPTILAPRARRLRRALTALLLAGSLASLLIMGDTSDEPAYAAYFVSRAGQSLTVDGSPWRFTGYDNYQLTSDPDDNGYSCGAPLSDQSLAATLLDAKNSGATVVRTWFFQSYYDLNSDGAPIAGNWSAFNRVLEYAAADGLRVIPVLVNEWQDCEPTWIPDATPLDGKNLGFFDGGYEHPGYGYPLSYLEYAKTVAAHYADDPTIAFWQLGNELMNDTNTTPASCSAGDESRGAAALRAFADNVTNTIKSVDPHHLVSLGTIGVGQCGLQGDDYATVHAGSVDLCEYHDYDDATDPIPDYGTYGLAETIQQCRSVGKPLFIGESGIPADVTDQGTESGTVTPASLRLRATFFDSKMTAAFNAGIVGYLIWDKRNLPPASGATRPGQDLYIIGPSSGADPDPTNAVMRDMATWVGG